MVSVHLWDPLCNSGDHKNPDHLHRINLWFSQVSMVFTSEPLYCFFNLKAILVVLVSKASLAF